VGHHVFYPEREEAAPAPGYNYKKDFPQNGPIEPPTAGKDGKFFWIRQNLPPCATLPEGFYYVMMGVVDCPDVILETVENQKGLGTWPYRGDETLDSTQKQYGADKKLIDEVWGLRPRYEPLREAKGVAATARISTDRASDFTVYVTLVTSLDADDPLATARKNLDRAIQRGYSQLLADQRKWWGNWYESFEESRMIFSDEEKNKSMIAEQFNEGISTKPDAHKLQGDAVYARMEQDWSPWHGDNHFNEPDLGLNHTDLFVANRPDCPELKRWYSIVEAFFPGAQLNAKQVYNCPGAFYGMLYVPIAPIPVLHTHVKWEQSMHQSAQIVKLLWLKYEYTGDEKWLKEHAYPIMRELAIFYAAYVKKENDGYFHLDPTVAAENRGIDKDT
ncbi:MAG: hypothetical protein NTW33_02290, partial [Methanoregula sp.]|nr:hypothetical protein [Methanoregula sp.]